MRFRPRGRPARRRILVAAHRDGAGVGGIGRAFLAADFITPRVRPRLLRRRLPLPRLASGASPASWWPTRRSGTIRSLCQADRAGLRFLVPLRADTGFRERFLAEVGSEGLRPLRYVSGRERGLPAKQRTRYRGALRDFWVTDPESGERRRFRVAYIHSSEEEREVAAARERALAKAEEALGRVKRGLGGRHYKTWPEQGELAA